MRPVGRQLALILAVCAGFALAHVGTSTMPFQIGALIDGSGRTAAEAGAFGMLEVGALALGMIAIAGWVARVPPLAIALAGCLLAALASMGLFWVRAAIPQMALAVIAGLGFGFVFAASVASAAATREPDRIYAIGNGGALLVIVGVMANIPGAAGRFGPLGIFAVLAALAVACLPFSFGLKAGKRALQPQTSSAAWRTPGAPGLLFAWAAFSMGTGALYAFSERIGKSIDLAPEAIAGVLSAGVFVGLIGTGAAAAIGSRINRPLILVVGMLGTALSCLVLGYAPNLLLFAAGVFLYWVFYMFLYSYLLGTAAILDPCGRVGTLGGGCERLGYALGAGLGGVLAEHLSYAATGLLGFLGCVLGLAIGFPSLFRALRARPIATARDPSPQSAA